MNFLFAFLAFTYCFNFNAMDSDDQDWEKKQKCESHLDFTRGNKAVAKLIDREIYGAMVDQSIICCVDIIVYDPIRKTYLTVIRRNRPAKGCRFVIGGRQQKHESFFDAARRKCLEETKILITPVCVLRTYSTVFLDSEWPSENGELATTHSVNTVVLAILRNDSPEVRVNDEHEVPRWLSITMGPSHPEIYRLEIFEYFDALYIDAMNVIGTHQTELEQLYHNPNLTIEINLHEAIRRLERERRGTVNPVHNNSQQRNESTDEWVASSLHVDVVEPPAYTYFS